MTRGFKKIKPATLFANKVRKTYGTLKKPLKKTSAPSGKNLPVVKGSSSKYIHTIMVLKKRDKSDEALHILQKLASMVKPIMRSHGLKVTTLCEFYPKNACLLGLNFNRGMKIFIRLRHPHNDKRFYTLTELLNTLLHELTHNIHGPHDSKFYSYLGELRTEMEDLMAQGFTGDGFFGKGQSVGTSSYGRNLSDVPVNSKGLADPVKLAEARKQRDELHKTQENKVKKNGQRLGTLTFNPDDKNLSMRELALRAAEQRMKDSKWCGKDTVTLDKANLEELGMDDEVIEIESFEFVGNNGNVSSSPLVETISTAKNLDDAEEKPPDCEIETLELVDLTQD